MYDYKVSQEHKCQNNNTTMYMRGLVSSLQKLNSIMTRTAFRSGGGTATGGSSENARGMMEAKYQRGGVRLEMLGS